MLTKDELIAFEKDIADEFLAAHIRAPIHLSCGNEDQLIEIFKGIKAEDWVFSTWRSHYHALLKGIPVDWLKTEIMAGRSMYIINKEHRFISSAIMGGILPIAVGMALGIKRKNLNDRVWAFLGDMAGYAGIYNETSHYALGHQLPVTFVIEDNGLSTNTPTEEVWGTEQKNMNSTATKPIWIGYEYKRVWPHTGIGKWVTFG